MVNMLRRISPEALNRDRASMEQAALDKWLAVHRPRCYAIEPVCDRELSENGRYVVPHITGRWRLTIQAVDDAHWAGVGSALEVVTWEEMACVAIRRHA